MFQNLFDSHTHSENSPDGRHSVTFMAETAAEKGIGGIAVTDHCDCSDLEEYSYEARLRHSALDVAVAREAFHNVVVLTTGIELSHPGYDMEGAERVLAIGHYDFILLSLHRIRGYEDFYFVNYRDMTAQAVHEMLLQYFDEMLGLVRWGRFDSLAHLTFPLRYLGYAGVDIDLRRYAEPIDAVLRALAGAGKALELNMSGLYGPPGATMPPAWVARRYRELGGELITIGSDAHRAGDIGRGVDEGMALLREIGYTHFAFYRDRKPVMLRII